MGQRNIGWAVDQIKAGRAVRRPHWGEGFHVAGDSIDVRVPRTPKHADMRPTVNVDILFIHMPSLNRVQPFTCHHDDLLATDWQLA